MSLIKQIFCNHTSQHCLTNFDNSYIDTIFEGKKTPGYSLWRCERCGKILKKKAEEAPSTFNWINLRVKESQE